MKQENEKRKVAFLSVLAAIFLTSFKIIVGVATGSLGILSEALHSGLDLVAAVITLFAVRMSSRPADEGHHYGHGKVENLSAFVETILLFITCSWIIYEAISRLVTREVMFTVNAWSYAVVLTSIVVDISRARALKRVARKYNSQALEADALHFSTDIWSSLVVLTGLIFASTGYYFADAIAGLIVALIVIYISYRLGRKAVAALLDAVPVDSFRKVEKALRGIDEILAFHDLKVRASGADTFVEVSIHVSPHLSIEEAHEIAHRAEKAITRVVDRCEVHVHAEPEPKLI